MPGTAAKIIISERQQQLLEEFRKSRTIGKCLAQPGSVPKQEFEYTRHGTTTLTAGLDVVNANKACSIAGKRCTATVDLARDHASNRGPWFFRGLLHAPRALSQKCSV